MAPHAENLPILRDRRFGAGLAVLFGGLARAVRGAADDHAAARPPLALGRL